MSSYFKLSLFTLLILSGFLVIGGEVWGQQKDMLESGLKAAGEGSFRKDGKDGKEATKLEATAATLIRAVLGLTGIIALIIIIYAGFLYLTASGHAEQIKKAQNMLVYAAIGLVLIFGAYTLASYVTRQLEQTTIKTN